VSSRIFQKEAALGSKAIFAVGEIFGEDLAAISA